MALTCFLTWKEKLRTGEGEGGECNVRVAEGAMGILPLE